MLKGQVTSRRAYQFMFPLPRAIVTVHEFTYAPGPDEVTPHFGYAYGHFERFIRPNPLSGAYAALVDVSSNDDVLASVPLHAILDLEAKTRTAFPERVFARGPREADGMLYMTHLVMGSAHYLVTAPLGLSGPFKLRNLGFGMPVTEPDEAELVGVDVRRLPL